MIGQAVEGAVPAFLVAVVLAFRLERTLAQRHACAPADVRERLTKKRKAGDQDAAMDPLADPAVRSAVLAATFEALIGFQLTEEQLKYNVTR